MRRPTKCELCRTRAFCLPKQFRTRPKMISKRTEYSTDGHRETVTEWHRETVETTATDDYRIALNGGRRNLVLSGALPTEGTDVYVLPNGLPK